MPSFLLVTGPCLCSTHPADLNFMQRNEKEGTRPSPTRQIGHAEEQLADATRSENPERNLPLGVYFVESGRN
ncbi:hypothetical protein BH09CHL1_BH09CHL1_26840 [soil metagenome]